MLRYWKCTNSEFFNGEMFNVTLYDVLHALSIMYNIIAVFQVLQNNFRIIVQNAGDESRSGVLIIENKNSHQNKSQNGGPKKQIRGSIESP